jgi:two-component system, sensor histidine kinase
MMQTRADGGAEHEAGDGAPRRAETAGMLSVSSAMADRVEAGPEILRDSSSALAELLKGHPPKPLDPSRYADTREKHHAKVVNSVIECVAEVWRFIVPLAQGNLSAKPPQRNNILASPYKELHSRLMHLTWQAQQVAKGDYSQRVDFMGDFSESFNSMVATLKHKEETLRSTISELERYQQQLEQTFAKLEMEVAVRTKAEAAQAEARLAADAANQAKSQFLANMSHEIRTPLNAVIGFTDLLLKSGNQCDEAEREDYLQTINTSGKHLLELINDILDLSKIEADRLDVEQVQCSPHEIISDIVSVMRVKALERQLTLDYHWRSGVPETICTDPARFRQVLMNLLSNAIKFTKLGGVRIVAELVRNKADAQLTIQVIDTGAGIPTERCDAIFDPFVQADVSVTRQFGGTGLGLTISRRIAEALGGGISVSSEVGKGSTFTLTIATGPLDDVQILDAPASDGMRSARQQRQEALPSCAGVRILLVEDGHTNRKLIGLVLRRAGAEVTMAENGRIGADLAMKTPFDLILMDMQMPVMDGYTASTLLRQYGVTVPILALTAHAMKGDQDKCLAAGCSGYVAKPIDADLLVRTIAGVLAGTAGTSQPCRAGSASREPDANDVFRGRTGQSPPGANAIFSALPTEDEDFREIVEEFIERLQSQLAAMQQAVDAQDFSALARLAHWLKGAGGTAGFPAFTKPARHLESLIRDQQYGEVEAALRDLVGLSQRIAVAPAKAPRAQSNNVNQFPESGT